MPGKATIILFCSLQERGADTIFIISNNIQVTPRYAINSSVYREGENEANVLTESLQYLFWRIDDSIQKKAYSGIYDKRSGKSFIYSQNDYADYRDEKKKKTIGIKNDPDGGLHVKMVTTKFSSSYWYYFIEPFELIEYINSSAFKNAVVKDLKKKEALLRFVKTLQEDDNPVLVTLTLNYTQNELICEK